MHFSLHSAAPIWITFWRSNGLFPFRSVCSPAPYYCIATWQLWCCSCVFCTPEKGSVWWGRAVRVTATECEEMADAKCKFTAEIYILKTLLYAWLSTLTATIQRGQHEVGDSLRYCRHINGAVRSHFKYQCSPLCAYMDDKLILHKHC